MKGVTGECATVMNWVRKELDDFVQYSCKRGQACRLSLRGHSPVGCDEWSEIASVEFAGRIISPWSFVRHSGEPRMVVRGRRRNPAEENGFPAHSLKGHAKVAPGFIQGDGP